MEKDYKQLYEDTFKQLIELTREAKSFNDILDYKDREINFKSERIAQLDRDVIRLNNKINLLISVQSPDSIELDKLRKESELMHKLKSSIGRLYMEARRD